MLECVIVVSFLRTHTPTHTRIHTLGGAHPLGHAEIAMACEQAAKNAILDHTTPVRNAELVAALEERRGMRV